MCTSLLYQGDFHSHLSVHSTSLLTSISQVEPDEDDDPLPSTDEEPVVDAEEYVINMQTVLEDEGATPAVLEDVAPGTICVTRWEGDLYRAVVVWVQHDFCKVRS